MSGIVVYSSQTQLKAISRFLLLVILSNSSNSTAINVPAKVFVSRQNLTCLCQLLRLCLPFQELFPGFRLHVPTYKWHATSMTLRTLYDILRTWLMSDNNR